MKKNSLNSLSSLVFSTNPDAMKPIEETPIDTLDKHLQNLRVMIDRKQRKGKTVTLVEGFQGNDQDLEALGKLLKTKCGTGGNVKDGQIIIQGDNKEKIYQLLVDLGYTKTKKAG